MQHDAHVEPRYVEHREGVYRIAGSRVSLDSIVHAFRDGQTAEQIADAFPVLSLEQVYGAIAFYLAHQAAIDRYLEAGRQQCVRQYQASREADPAFYDKLDRERWLA